MSGERHLHLVEETPEEKRRKRLLGLTENLLSRVKAAIELDVQSPNFFSSLGAIREAYDTLHATFYIGQTVPPGKYDENAYPLDFAMQELGFFFNRFGAHPEVLPLGTITDMLQELQRKTEEVEKKLK